MGENDHQAVSRLSETQKQLLRLVHQGTSRSKPLAHSMLAAGVNLEPGSIKTYLYQAAKILGASSREEAAARFAALEAAAVPPPDVPAYVEAPHSGELPSEFTRIPLAVQSQGLPIQRATAVKRFFTGMPIGGQQHAFRGWVTTLLIMRAAVIGMTGLTAVVLFVFGFLKAFSHFSH